MSVYKDIEDFVTSKEFTDKYINTLFERKGIDKHKFKISGSPDVANGLVFRCYFEVAPYNNVIPPEITKVGLFIVLKDLISSEDNPFMSIKNYSTSDLKSAVGAKILAAIWSVYTDTIIQKFKDKPGKYYKLMYWVEYGDYRRYWEED